MRRNCDGSGCSDNTVHSIHFQIWRPAQSVARDSCYNLVGEDRYANISFNERVRIPLNRTLQDVNFITVQPGDVVGFYTRRESGHGLRLLLDGNYEDETIWFSRNIERGPPVVGDICPYPVGPGRELTRSSSAAVVLSVAMSKYTHARTLLVWFAHGTRSRAIKWFKVAGHTLINAHHHDFFSSKFF